MNSTNEDNAALVKEFLEATSTGDVATMERLAHDDFVMFWPQSGERFSGRANAIGAMLAQRDRPEPAGEPRLVGSGDVWVYMVPLRYGENDYQYVGILELAGGRVVRGTGYFAAPFPAQEYRAQFADN
jgi:ketosteroid isomerase-like protein